MIAAACAFPDFTALMAASHTAVDVEFERVAIASAWADARWQPASIAPAGASGTAQVAPCRVDAGRALERWRFGGHALEWHPTEAEGYFLNLASPEPKAFVMWRAEAGREPPIDIVVVTLSYHQAARMLDGGEQVDAVPLDPALRSLLEPYVAAHYKPEPRRKVRRNDPFAADRERGEPGKPGR